MTVRLENLSAATARFDASSPVVSHAANELRAHARGAQGNVTVSLEAGNSRSDAFETTVSEGLVTIRGDSPRGALNGVYWLLERLGWRWVRPGADGARFIPNRTVAYGTYRQEPAFPRRTLILGNDALHDEWRDWLEFASRNRCNSVFFHDTPPSVLDRGGPQRPASAEEIASDGKGWLFERWDTDGAEIVAEASRRGIALQFGGHHLPALLRRELFADYPDWFPVRHGVRDAKYNLCTANEGALGEVRSRAVAFFRRFDGAEVYHLWADDILGGGWCECVDCSRLSPSDQALKATNVVADALAEVSPGASIVHLAYHDTIAPPSVHHPASNVSALYAPRNRNYAFAIDDPSCRRNREEHHAELLGLAETFAGHELAVFEYYSDAILYKWLDPPNIDVLPKDAAAYHAAGVTDFGDLAVTPRPWVGPTWHAWWFARCAWDPGVDRDAELDDFCAAAFEQDGPEFAAVFRAWDAAYRDLLDLGGLERIPRHDVLDFSDAPREALTRKAIQLRSAVEAMNAAVSGLPLAPKGLGPGFREDAAIQLATANHLAERVSAWDAALDARAGEAEKHLTLARMHLSAMTDWDRTHTGAAYANLSRNMLRAASYHTERIARLLV